MISSHLRAIMFTAVQPSAALQTLAIFEVPIPSLVRQQTRRQTTLVRWTMECELCSLAFDGVVGSEWFCSAISLTITHSSISFLTIPFLLDNYNEYIMEMPRPVPLVFVTAFVTFFVTNKLSSSNLLVHSVL